MTPIRTIHFADLHLGVETHGRVDPATGLNSRINDFLHGLDQIVAAAKVHNCDLVIFAGDAFKNPRPSPTMIREFSERIKELADYATVLLLVGNHDAPKSPHLASSLDVFQALDIPDVIVGNTPGSQVMETPLGDKYFLSWMPFPFRERLMAKTEYADATIEEMDEIHRAKVNDILKHKAREAAAKDMPCILAGHFGVVGAEPGTSTAYFGHDVLIEAEALSEGWDYVALGHYHGYQVLNDYPPVIYSGSPDRISFNEQEETKGFVIAQVGYTPEEKTTWKFHELDTRPFVTMTIDIREEEDPTGVVIGELDAALEGAIVRIKVQMLAEQSISERAIQESLPSVETLYIIKEVDEQVRLRLDDSQVSTMTPGELVDTYFERRGLDKDRRQALTRSAKEIIDESNRAET